MQARTKLAEERARAASEVKALQARIARERAKADPDGELIANRTERLARAQKAADDLARAENALPNDKTNFNIVSAPGSPGGNWFEAKWQHAKENPALLLYKLKSSAYKYSWALIPISLPFIWLLFPFRRDVACTTTQSSRPIR